MQSLQAILDPRPITERTTATTAQQTTWLKDTAPRSVEDAREALVQANLLIDTLSAYPECLKVSRGPATIATIDLVMMILLVLSSTKSCQRRGWRTRCTRCAWRRVGRRRT